jgi:hypothetical protein
MSISVIPTRYFLGRPDVGEEMHISIEKGKTLIIRLMAVGPVVEGRAQRDVWFEVNGEVRPSKPHSLMRVDLFYLRSARYLLRTRTRLSRPSRGRRPPAILDRLGLPCQAWWSRSESRKARRSKRVIRLLVCAIFDRLCLSEAYGTLPLSSECHEGEYSYPSSHLYMLLTIGGRWNPLLPHRFQDTSNALLCRKVKTRISAFL